MTNKALRTLAALILAPIPALVAGTTEAKPEAPKAPDPFITGDFGVAFVSQYISRGVVNENQGVIAQPYLDLFFSLYSGTGFLNKVTLNLGLWSSIDAHHTAATPGTPFASFYEFDYLPGITFTFAKDFSFTASYYEFDFISSGGRSGNVNLSLAYDDSKPLGNWAMHPHFTYLKSVIGNPDGVPGANRGSYYEIGVAPGHTWGPLTITVPLTLGLGDKKFYGGKTYGYFSAGVTAAVPLAFIPATYGKWTMTTGVTYYNQSSRTALASSPGINDGGHTQWVFSGGIGTTF